MQTTLKTFTQATRLTINAEKKLRGTEEVFLLFLMGSQTSILIKHQLERLGVYVECADPSTFTAEDVRGLNPKGIIISGGPDSVTEGELPFDRTIFALGIPVLGICLGFQMWAKYVGAKVETGEKGEFGPYTLRIHDQECLLLDGCFEDMVIQNHADRILPLKHLILSSASTENSPVAVAQNQHLFGVQFHPEMSGTVCGEQIFYNFCFKICGAKDRFPAENVAEKKITELRPKVDGKTVLIALSGGSDSSIVAHLLINAASPTTKLVAVYIKGIDRPADEENVRKFFGNHPRLELCIVDATGPFIKALGGKLTSRWRRAAVREVYKAVLEKQILLFKADFIAQGTLHTDLAESGMGLASMVSKTAEIKLHHNVNLEFSVPELMPLDDQVKDTARGIGRAIGVPEALLVRQPFPGPGLAVRMYGEFTRERVERLRQLDSILDQELKKWSGYQTVWQSGVVLTNLMHTRVKGDGDAHGEIVMWFAVNSVNGFTAEACDVSYAIRQCVRKRMENEVKGVGAVSYRDSGKPSATIECM